MIFWDTWIFFSRVPGFAVPSRGRAIFGLGRGGRGCCHDEALAEGTADGEDPAVEN